MHDDERPRPPIAPNILARRFEADAPNQRCVGDTTELRVGESGRVFLAAILDLYSRSVVGWAAVQNVKEDGRSRNPSLVSRPAA